MRKKSIKLITVLVCLAVLTAVFSGCGATTITKPTPDPYAQPQTVSGSCTLTTNNGVITVSGKIDVDAGAKLNVSVVGQDGMVLDSVNITKTDGDISESFSISDKYNVDKVQGFITFAPTHYGSQPKAIFDRYGKKFENINDVKIINADNSLKDGDILWDNEGIIVIFASELTDLNS